MSTTKKNTDGLMYGLQKIAVSIYDPNQYGKLQQSQNYGAMFPAFGMLLGGSTGGYLAKTMMESSTIKSKPLKMLGAGAAYIGAGATGLLGGMLAKKMRRDQFIKSLPPNDPFKKAYTKERARLKRLEIEL